jgi:predicted HAD superfamily Cof-like phosphohydrolase
MKAQLAQVKDFHEKFQQSLNDKPGLLSPEESRLRFKLGEEEVVEYWDATKEDDLVEILDALADQMYILCGTILKHGLQDMIIPAFDLVHNNNMMKLGPDGKPIFREDGKIIKPEGFKKVELKTLFTTKD